MLGGVFLIFFMAQLSLNPELDENRMTSDAVPASSISSQDLGSGVQSVEFEGDDFYDDEKTVVFDMVPVVAKAQGVDPSEVTQDSRESVLNIIELLEDEYKILPPDCLDDDPDENQ